MGLRNLAKRVRDVERQPTHYLPWLGGREALDVLDRPSKDVHGGDSAAPVQQWHREAAARGTELQYPLALLRTNGLQEALQHEREVGIRLLEILIVLVRRGVVEPPLHVLPVRGHRPLW